MLWKTDFEADWIVEMRRIMEEHWAMDLASAKTEELAALFFHARTRRVEPRPRVVHLSNAFVCPLEHEAGWAELKVKIETGEDLSPHLSLKIEDFKGKDGLLLDWGIYHFHLGRAQHAKNKSFVERTGPLVFGFPTDDAFHAVGIYRHGTWSDSSVIETLHANWPHLTRAARMQGSGMSLGQLYTDADREMLRAAGSSQRCIMGIERRTHDDSALRLALQQSHDALSRKNMIREIENSLMAAFDQTMCKYRQILNNYYPAHKSTGFTERNLTNNFVRALENVLGKDAFAWFEAPLSSEEKLYLDAIVFDPTTKSCFLIEAKRFSNLNKKIAETIHDIQRMSYQAHHATLELGLDKLKIEHRYAIVLVDIWTEGEAKQVTFENWPACLDDASLDLIRTGGFENLMIEKEWKHNYKIMMAAKKL